MRTMYLRSDTNRSYSISDSKKEINQLTTDFRFIGIVSAVVITIAEQAGWNTSVNVWTLLLTIDTIVESYRNEKT